MDALLRTRAGSEQLRFGASSEIAVLADGAATGGKYVLSEHVLQAGARGPQLHRHRELIDSFYVLEGELTFRLEEEVVRAPAGTYVLIPPGVLHTFANDGDVTTRFLGLSAPAGLDAYLRRTSDPCDDAEFEAAVADFDIEFADG